MELSARKQVFLSLRALHKIQPVTRQMPRRSHDMRTPSAGTSPLALGFAFA
jgi:hypothetical protein